MHPFLLVYEFLPVVDFHDDLHLLQREASLMRDEGYIYLWVSISSQQLETIPVGKVETGSSK